MMLLASHRRYDSVAWMGTIHVDNVYKMHTEKDSMDRAKYSEWFASKCVLLLHNVGF